MELYTAASRRPTRLALLHAGVLLAATLSPSSAYAQEEVRAPLGVISGQVVDSAAGIPVIRINFVPTARTRSADWAGSLLLDSASAVLLRSEALLVNLPARSTFAAARCIVDYTMLAPTLVHESRAVCGIARATRPATYVLERWTLKSHAFLRGRPDSADAAIP